MNFKIIVGFRVKMHVLCMSIVVFLWTGSGMTQRPTGTRSLDIPAAQNLAQQPDSSIQKELIFAFYRLDDLGSILTIYDTSLTNIHRVEPHYRTDLDYGNLGSENAASYRLIWVYDADIGISMGQNSYEPNFGNRNANRLFDLNRPYWSFHFGQGFNIGSTNIDARFYKRFARNILLNFSYRLLSDASVTGGLANDFKNMDIKLSQFSEKNRRRTTTGFRSYRISDEFSLTGVDVFGTVPGGLQSSSEYYAINEIDFKDSSKINIMRLSSKLSLKSDSYSFMDDQISTDERQYYQLADSFSNVNYMNELAKIGFTNRFDIKNNDQGYYGKMDVALFDHKLLGFNESLQEITIGAGLIHRLDSLKVNIDSELGLLDASGAYRLSSHLSLPVGQQLFGAQVSLSSNVPSLLFRRVQINENRFSADDLQNVTSYSLAFSYTNSKLDLNARLHYHSNKNVLILMPSLEVFQISEPVQAIHGVISKTFTFGNFANQLSGTYQSISSELIQRPNFIADWDVYMDFQFFKNRMDTRIGADFKFVKSFVVPGYSHVLGIPAYDDRQQSSGDLFLLNPYASIKVDKFYAFIKVNNALSRLRKDSIYWINGFPIYDFRLVFGIRWDLLD